MTLLAFMTVWLFQALAGRVTLEIETPGGGHRISVGDTFYITVTAIDEPGNLDLSPSFPGAKCVYKAPFQQVSSHSDGRHTVTSRRVGLTLTLKAVKPGKYKYGPVSVGKSRSNTVSYEIVNGPAGVSGGASSGGASRSGSTSADPFADEDPNAGPTFIGKGSDELFLVANVSKTRAWEQEALVYTVKLYTTCEPIKFLGATAAPKFDGFVVEESKDVSSSLSFESYKGKTYSTAIIARYIIFPQKTGKLRITGNTYTVSTDARQYYHDPYYQTLTVRRPISLNVTPNDLVVDVQPLPSPQPAGFSGGVGQFRLSARLATQKFNANQAGSIIYEITGTGNLRYVKLPDLAGIYPPELDIFTPESKDDLTVGASNVSGRVTFDYSFMPRESGEYRIPEVPLVFFNPSTGKYETVRARGFDISVGKGDASARSQKVARFDRDLMTVDIASASSRSAWIDGFPYWLWYIVPVVGLLLALLIWRKHMKDHADMVSLRSRRAGKMARRRLRKAAACMKRGDADHFYDEVLTALWGYLSDKLKMPTSELTRQNVRETLAARGVGDSELDPLIELIDDCEFARYAPSRSGGRMEHVYENAVAVINGIDSRLSQNQTKGGHHDA